LIQHLFFSFFLTQRTMEDDKQKQRENN